MSGNEFITRFQTAGAMTILVALGGCIFKAGCTPSAGDTQTHMVSRQAYAASNEMADQLVLLIRIDGDGVLTLNNIRTGTLKDPSELTERLSAVLNDRKRIGIEFSDVLIDAERSVDHDDVQKLAEVIRTVSGSTVKLIDLEP